MNASLFKKLIDEHVIPSIVTAITTCLQEGQQQIMNQIDELKADVDELKSAVAAEHTRIDTQLSSLTDQLKAKATEHDDPELAALAADIKGVTSGLQAFHPAPAATAAAADTSGTSTSSGTGATPPASGSDPSPTS